MIYGCLLPSLLSIFTCVEPLTASLSNRPFEFFILATILANCIALAINHPYPMGDYNATNVALVCWSLLLFPLAFTGCVSHSSILPFLSVYVCVFVYAHVFMLSGEDRTGLSHHFHHWSRAENNCLRLCSTSGRIFTKFLERSRLLYRRDWVSLSHPYRSILVDLLSLQRPPDVALPDLAPNASKIPNWMWSHWGPSAFYDHFDWCRVFQVRFIVRAAMKQFYPSTERSYLSNGEEEN